MKELHARVAGEVRKVVVGQAEALEDMMAALALGGLVLLEGLGLADDDLAYLTRDAGVQRHHDDRSLSFSGFARTSAAESAST